LSQASRTTPGKIFQQVGDALLQRRQLQIDYKSFSNQRSKRAISPQTLVYYRENWYLDAWCHLRNGLRGGGILDCLVGSGEIHVTH